MTKRNIESHSVLEVCAKVKRMGYTASSRFGFMAKILKYCQTHFPRMAESPFTSKRRKTQGFACCGFPQRFFRV